MQYHLIRDSLKGTILETSWKSGKYEGPTTLSHVFFGTLTKNFEFSGLDLHPGVNVFVQDPNIMGQIWDKTNFKIVIFLGQTSLKNEVSHIRWYCVYFEWSVRVLRAVSLGNSDSDDRESSSLARGWTKNYEICHFLLIMLLCIAVLFDHWKIETSWLWDLDHV